MGFGSAGGFWRKQGGGDICTPYGITIPYDTNIIAHSSLYNICDIWRSTDQTLPLKDLIPPENGSCSFISDISGGASYPLVAAIDSRSASYKTDDGIYGSMPKETTGVNVFYYVNDSWRINSDVKTIVFLVKLDNIASNLTTRIIRNQLILRFNSGNLSVFDGSNRDSALAGASNTWHIVSIRTDGNIVLGLDKSYQQVKATSPSIVNENFAIFSTQDSARVLGGFREIIMFSESISDADLDDISDWLTTKWNL